jgi:hypothetical protein
MSNIVFVFHGLCEKAKAMSKTARRSCAWRSHERQKHPAILPWPSGLSDQTGAWRPHIGSLAAGLE